MKKLRRFAPIGLYISGLAVIASVVLYAIYRTFDLPLQISLAMIVVGLALYVLLDPQRTRRAPGSRTLKQRSILRQAATETFETGTAPSSSR